MRAVDVDTGEVVDITGTHPIADLFPMLDEEDLADLVASIAERGLEQPIVVDNHGRVLDGRNRLAACEQAGVKPTVTRYGGDDPDGYAVTVNVSRRSLTKGQKAMIVARYRSETDQSLESVARSEGLTKTRLANAVTVLQHAPDLVDAVISGATGLDAAYKTAGERKRDAESAEERMARLRSDAPDLAELVADERMNLAEATRVTKERAKAERENAEQNNTVFAKAIQALYAVHTTEFRDRTLTEWRTYACKAPPTAVDLVTPDNLRGIGNGLRELADAMETLNA